MKKGLILSVLSLFVFFIAGCGNKNAEYKKTMESYSKDYFEKYAITNGIDEFEIKISDLKNANNVGSSNYDLKKLDKCTDDSKVIFSLDKDSKEIKKTTFDLNCK